MTDLEIVAVFAQCFWASHATELIGGAAEPLYQPAQRSGEPHRLFYRENFAASALHETAHWCVAGSVRRTQTDFGYVYNEPPRSARAQAAFFAAELKVQALEQVFCEAAGLVFVPSADQIGVNLNEFRQRLDTYKSEVRGWMQSSRDDRARHFEQALIRHVTAQRRAAVG
ncbi:MAG: elongation factor P hydroxylase [Pseudomonadaceae bacterium]|nr:elongation factor P hydroxylase [Pseudomonadaceae bacterium]